MVTSDRHAAVAACRTRLAALALALLVLPILVAPAGAQGRITARHGDWQVRCEQPVGAPSEQCALVQNVEAQDRANVSLTVIFLLTADRQARILRVLAPLGVLLPSGLGLSIDDNEVGLAGFVRCVPEGCVAEVELDDGLIERFEAGNTATFVIFQTPEEGIGIPISLNGFEAGFQALDQPPPPPEDVAASDAPPRPPVTAEVRAVDGTATQSTPTFAEPADTRSEIDRLLEDDLFPFVAGGVVLILLMVIAVVWVLLRAGRSAPKPARAARPASPARRRQPPRANVPVPAVNDPAADPTGEAQTDRPGDPAADPDEDLREPDAADPDAGPQAEPVAPRRRRPRVSEARQLPPPDDPADIATAPRPPRG